MARNIVESAAEDLVGLALPLIPLFGPRGPVQVALAGGNLAPERGLRAPVVTRMRGTPRLAIREAPLDPAEGALALARRVG